MLKLRVDVITLDKMTQRCLEAVSVRCGPMPVGRRAAMMAEQRQCHGDCTHMRTPHEEV